MLSTEAPACSGEEASPAKETKPVVVHLLRSVPAGARLVVANHACLVRLRNAVDHLGPDAELRSNEVIWIEAKTRIEVIRRSPSWVVLRVLEGPHAGRIGVSIPDGID